ncbi:MAG: FtsX-like permease family protein [Promethearchaeota archaeon]
MAIFNYLFKTLARNKKRSLMIIFGIAIASSLITGINVSMDALTYDMFSENFRQIYCDFSVTTDVPFDGNFSKFRNMFEPLKENYSEVSEIFGSVAVDLYDTCYNFTGSPINWSYLEKTNFNRSLFTRMKLYGIDEGILNLPQMADLIEFTDNMTFSFNTSNQVYVDIKTAVKYNLTVGQNISIGNLYKDYDYGYDYDYDEGQITVTNYTFSEDNITIAGIFRIIDQDSFNSLFPGYYSYSYYPEYYGYEDYYYYSEDQISILTNADFAYDLFIDLTDYNSRQELYSYTDNWMIGIICDHDQYNFINPDSITSFSRRLSLQIQYTSVLYYFEVNNYGSNILNMVQAQISMFSMTIFMISIPVFIIGWFLIKTNYFVVLNNRRREIGLLMTRSASNRQLLLLFFAESILFGLIGGLFGVIFGYISGVLIYTNFSTLHPVFSFDLLLLFLPSVKYSTFLIGTIVGIIFSIISAWSPIKTFSNLIPSDALRKYNEEVQTEIKIGKKDWFLLILSISVILFSALFDPSSIYSMAMIAGPFIIVIYIFLMIGPYLLPIVPFILSYEIVKILCNLSLDKFTAVVSWFAKIVNKKTHFFISRSITGNRSRSTRLVTIIAISLSFLIVSDTITASQQQYEHDTKLIYLGGDVNIEISGSHSVQPGNLSKNGIWPYISALNENDDLNISKLTVHEISDSVDFIGGSSVNMVFLNPKNYTENMENMDRFIVGRSADSLFFELNATSNGVIVPSSFLESNAISVGQEIYIRYRNKSDSTDYKLVLLKIIGEYSVLPGIEPGSSWYLRSYLICKRDLNSNSSLFPDITISKYRLLIKYNHTGLTIEELEYQNTMVTGTLEEFDPTIYINEPYSYMFRANTIGLSMMDFYSIEKIYLLIFVGIGVGVIMYSSIQEKSFDFGLLRAKGVDKKTIFLTQLSEGAVLLTMGAIVSLTGIFSAFGLNNMQGMSLFSMSMGSSIPRAFIVPIWQILIELVLSIGVFMGIIYLATHFVSKESNIDKISSIFRMA